MTTNRARKSTAQNTAQSTAIAGSVGTDDALAELQVRAANAASRIARIGIPKQELASRAGVDRGTLGRALKADPRTLANDARTWRLIERELDRLEEEIGLKAELQAPTTSAELVTSTVEYEKDGTRAKITMSGRAEAVAEAIRRVLAGE